MNVEQYVELLAQGAHAAEMAAWLSAASLVLGLSNLAMLLIFLARPEKRPK